jgi:hypothetical protein
VEFLENFIDCEPVIMVREKEERKGCELGREKGRSARQNGIREKRTVGGRDRRDN